MSSTLAARAARLDHFGAHGQAVTRAHRIGPLDVGQAGRGEGFGIVQRDVDQQAHGDGASAPAAGDQAAEAVPGGCGGVGVEPLRIVGGCEADDLGLAYRVGARGPR